ncbi:uncharacterized protein LOC102959460 [Panthera tigris]|uniref:uncharacterized protein LOC102959460 n=1 Tax=Panthera tigris TaxID=9694 RepID=UPI001C6F5F09|nr:uncharacterized protein LOC102959460 [Panthera tigris]
MFTLDGRESLQVKNVENLEHSSMPGTCVSQVHRMATGHLEDLQGQIQKCYPFCVTMGRASRILRGPSRFPNSRFTDHLLCARHRAKHRDTEKNRARSLLRRTQSKEGVRLPGISSFGRRGICLQEKTSSRPMSLREESILTHLNCYSSKTCTRNHLKLSPDYQQFTLRTLPFSISRAKLSSKLKGLYKKYPLEWLIYVCRKTVIEDFSTILPNDPYARAWMISFSLFPGKSVLLQMASLKMPREQEHCIILHRHVLRNQDCSWRLVPLSEPHLRVARQPPRPARPRLRVPFLSSPTQAGRDFLLEDEEWRYSEAAWLT